jgi:hypothetical protein
LQNKRKKLKKKLKKLPKKERVKMVKISQQHLKKKLQRKKKRKLLLLSLPLSQNLQSQVAQHLSYQCNIRK